MLDSGFKLRNPRPDIFALRPPDPTLEQNRQSLFAGDCGKRL
ncbi:hypothetical protein AVEN_136235-1, partial [Araneus ventricosus]